MPLRWRNGIPKANLYWIPMLVLPPSLASSTNGKAHLESDVYVQYSMVRPILSGKKLAATQAKYEAPKLEMYAAYHFIVQNHSYLCPRKFTLRVDNQALSWLKTYSTDQALIGRWIMTLENTIFG